MRSLGSGSMITPVENGKTCCADTPRRCASASQVLRARAKPSAPVPALALPVLISKARICPPAAKCAWHTCTGAAQKRLAVKAAPTLVPSSSKNTVKSLRSALRIPACTTPMRTPAIGKSWAGLGGAKSTGMVRSQASLPWHCLNFFPLPQGQGSLRPTRGRAAALGARSAKAMVSGSPVSVGAV